MQRILYNTSIERSNFGDTRATPTKTPRGKTVSNKTPWWHSTDVWRREAQPHIRAVPTCCLVSLTRSSFPDRVLTHVARVSPTCFNSRLV